MTALAYCTVIGKFADFTVDGTDGGADPDAAPLVGQVTLTCDARDLGDNPTTARLLLPTETPPRTITIEPFPVTLDGTGSMSVEVVATGQTGVTVPSVFTYTASFALKTATGAKVRIPSFSFSAPAGTTVDLALVAPAVTENGINYIIGPQGPAGPPGPGGGGGGAGLPANILTKTAAFTAAAGDFILANGGAGGFPVTLPLSPAVGALVVVKKTDGTASTITVLPSGGGTIDGDPNATIVSPQFGGVFEHVGSNAWELVAPTSPGGSNGTNGNTVLNGTGAPASGLGVNGDFYVNTTAHTLYGPKASGAWPGSPLSLIGPSGANGTNGAIALIQDEGSALTVRPTLDFVGAGVGATDDAANGRTVITIPGGSTGAAMPIYAPSGLYITPPGYQAGANTYPASIGAMVTTPMPIVACTVDRIGINVSAAAAGSLVRLGIYAATAAGLPGALILDAGTVDSSTTGYKEIIINQALSTGLVYLVAVAQTTTAGSGPSVYSTIGMPVVLGFSNAAQLSSRGIGAYASSGSSTTGALPGTFGALSIFNITDGPRILLRVV